MLEFLAEGVLPPSSCGLPHYARHRCGLGSGPLVRRSDEVKSLEHGRHTGVGFMELYSPPPPRGHQSPLGGSSGQSFQIYRVLLASPRHQLVGGVLDADLLLGRVIVKGTPVPGGRLSTRQRYRTIVGIPVGGRQGQVGFPQTGTMAATSWRRGELLTAGVGSGVASADRPPSRDRP